MTEEQRMKLSEAKKGKPLSREHVENMRTALNSERIREKLRNSHLGKTMSNKTRQRMSWSKMGHSVSGETRRKIREYALSRISKHEFGGMPVVPRIGINEKSCLDTLRSAGGVDIVRQFRVSGFFLDGYIKDAKLAVEFDERFHGNRKERDNFRRNEIQRDLGCEFFVVSEEQWKEPGVVTERFLQVLRGRMSNPTRLNEVAEFNIR